MTKQYEVKNGKVFIAKGTFVVVSMISGKKYAGELLEDYTEGSPAIIASDTLSSLPLPASGIEFVAPSKKREERQPYSNRGRELW